MPTDLTSLRDEIAACSPGGTVVISYQEYGKLFLRVSPTFMRDQTAWTFARENGCWLLIRPSETVVEFVKLK